MGLAHRQDNGGPRPAGRNAQAQASSRRPASAPDRRSKPDVPAAMRQLIAEVRAAIPFDSPDAQVCSGICDGCSLKLIEYLDDRLRDWEARLDAGERPGLKELSRLARTSRKVHAALARNGVVSARPDS